LRFMESPFSPKNHMHDGREPSRPGGKRSVASAGGNDGALPSNMKDTPAFSGIRPSGSWNGSTAK